MSSCDETKCWQWSVPWFISNSSIGCLMLRLINNLQWSTNDSFVDGLTWLAAKDGEITSWSIFTLRCQGARPRIWSKIADSLVSVDTDHSTDHDYLSPTTHFPLEYYFLLAQGPLRRSQQASALAVNTSLVMESTVVSFTIADRYTRASIWLWNTRYLNYCQNKGCPSALSCININRCRATLLYKK